jgi:CHASE2 domain-containing sensor protein
MLLLLLTYGLAQTTLLDPLEWGYYDGLLARITSTDRSGKVVVLDSGAATTQADLAAAVGKLRGAGAVALMVPLNRRENAAALQRLTQMNDEKPGEKGLTALAKALDSSARLASVIKRAGNVWLTSYVTSHTPPVATDAASYLRYLRSLAHPMLPQLSNSEPPLEELLKVAKGVGVVQSGERAASLAAAVLEDDSPLPSLLYQLLPSDLQRQAGESLVYRYFPKVDTANTGGLAVHSLGDLIEGKVAARALQGKTVLVGDASSISGYAVALDALLHGQQVILPRWARWAQYGALFGVALFLMLLLPRLGLTSGLFSSLLLLFLLLNTEALFLLLFSQWLPLMLPTLLLLLGYVVVTLQRRVSLRQGGLVQELSASNMQLGRMLQSQGELEQAWEKYRRCINNETLREQLYNLGLDFERKRQFNKAVALFDELQRMARNFRDVAERLQRNREMGDRIVLAQGSAAPGGTVVMEATQGLQRPTLGHYHIEKEIGRGAMGLVYLGQDPRINREVAIKTMALSHEFEGQELKEVKQRFYREAETAGRLNHPNIVR